MRNRNCNGKKSEQLFLEKTFVPGNKSSNIMNIGTKLFVHNGMYIWILKDLGGEILDLVQQFS